MEGNWVLCFDEMNGEGKVERVFLLYFFLYFSKRDTNTAIIIFDQGFIPIAIYIPVLTYAPIIAPTFSYSETPNYEIDLHT